MQILKSAVKRIICRSSGEKASLPAFSVPIGARYLFFGDSVFQRVSRRDNCNKPLELLISEKYPASHAYVFSHSAFAIPHYLTYMACNKKSIAGLGKILVPINYRSLSHQWEHSVDWDYSDEMRNLAYTAGDCGLCVDDLFRIADRRSMSAEYFFYGRKSGEFFDLKRAWRRRPMDEVIEERRRLFSYHYLFDSDVISKSSRVMALHILSEMFSEMRDRIIFFMLPINYDAVGYLFGGRAVDYLGDNISHVVKLVNYFGFKCHDFSMAIDRFGFFNLLESTEHLNEIGRGILLDRITGVVGHE